jgi:hypothetical protein
MSVTSLIAKRHIASGKFCSRSQVVRVYDIKTSSKGLHQRDKVFNNNKTTVMFLSIYYFAYWHFKIQLIQGLK